MSDAVRATRCSTRDAVRRAPKAKASPPQQSYALNARITKDMRVALEAAAALSGRTMSAVAAEAMWRGLIEMAKERALVQGAYMVAVDASLGWGDQ